MNTKIEVKKSMSQTHDNPLLKEQKLKKNLMKLGISSFLMTISLCIPFHTAKAKKLNTQDPTLHLRKVGYGHLAARALHVACYYKLFDSLQSGPKSPQEMVLGTKLQASSVRRIMRVLANHDLVMMDEKGHFSLNKNSAFLVSTAPNSLQPALAKEFDIKRWQGVGNIHLTLQEDVVPFDEIFGVSYYGYLEQDEVASKLFNKGMMNFSEREDAETSTHYPFQNFKSYCDVGGGTGGLISQVVTHHSKVKGILFDLPEAVKGCNFPNVTTVGGSFFDAVPSAELYTVKRVLHNWKNEECVKILKNISQALLDRNKGRILVIEKVLPRKVDGSFLIDSDIIGLALGGGERTLGEFIEIAKAAELELEEQITLPSGVSILVLKHT